MFRKGNRTSLPVRVAVLLAASLQAGATGVLPALDALLEAESVHAAAHVESAGNEACDAHHDHLFCQVVRSLASGLQGSEPPTARSTHPVEVLALEHDGYDVRRLELLPGSTHPRAPPLV